MISPIQKPTIRQIVGALAGTHAQPHVETAWWGQAENLFWTSRGAWGIAAVAEARRFATGRTPRVWLPDYFCNESLGPLRALGATLFFYPVDSVGVPEWDTCRRLAAAHRPDIVLLVHYFGLPNDAIEGRRFADVYDAILMEDAAHILRPEPGIGNHGDFVLYCPHKWLALPDGAVLAANGTSRSRATPLARAFRAFGSVPAPVAMWMTKRLVQMSPFASLATRLHPGPRLSFEEDPAAKSFTVPVGMSRTAGRLLATQDLSAVIETRRCNHDTLAAVLRSLSANVLSDGAAVPYRLVLQFTDRAATSDLYARLQRHGLPVETWPDIPPEVAANPQEHTNALALRQTRVLLPIHQSLSAAKLAHSYRDALRAR